MPIDLQSVDIDSRDQDLEMAETRVQTTESNCSLPESTEPELIVPESTEPELIEPELMVSASDGPTSDEPLTGYELIADMMRRQDDVIGELDSLNVRIESAIKEITDARKLEEQAAEGVEAEQGMVDQPADQARTAA